MTVRSYIKCSPHVKEKFDRIHELMKIKAKKNGEAIPTHNCVMRVLINSYYKEGGNNE